MKTLIKVFVNGAYQKLKMFKFSGGEYQVSLPKLEVFGDNTIKVGIEAYLLEGNIMPLALVIDAIRRMYTGKKLSIGVHIPYLPYARQDRVMNIGESLALKVFCEQLNSLNLDRVIVSDCHSDVGLSLINNVEHVEQSLCPILLEWTNESKQSYPFDAIVAPDAGALKKVFKVAKHAKIPEVIRADKRRDVSTGEITGTEIYDDVDGKRLLVIDDICDGGMTFIKLAEELRKKGAKHLTLQVTHGIFSKGTEELEKLYDKIVAVHDYSEMFKGE